MSDPLSPAPAARHHRRHRRSWRRARLLLTLAALIWAGALITLLVSRAATDFNRPLGAPLGAISSASLPGSGQAAASIPSSLPAVNTAPAAQQGQAQCGGPPQMDLLLIGADTNTANSVRGLADTIRVLHLDFVNPRISAIAVPRVMWVYVPSLAGYSDVMSRYFGQALGADGQPLGQQGPYTTLNSSYFYGDLYGLPGGGPTVLAEALYLNFGIAADHYVAVDMATAGRMIDAVGGLEVDVPYAVDTTPAGLQHMSGEQALAYARTRETDNDWYRVERQNIVLHSAWTAITRPANAVRIPGLIDRFAGQVKTDLSKAQLTNIVCLMSRVGADAVSYYTFSPDTVTVTTTTQGFFILLPDQARVAAVVSAFRGP